MLVYFVFKFGHISSCTDVRSEIQMVRCKVLLPIYTKSSVDHLPSSFVTFSTFAYTLTDAAQVYAEEIIVNDSTDVDGQPN